MLPIRGNVGDIDKMFDAIWAVFYHVIIDPSLTLDEQHKLCPRQGWCKYWTDVQNYNESRRLPAVFGDLLKPIFNRLSDRTLLARCQGGYTQNQNESVNNVLWSRCLKTKFCGYNKVYLAVCDAVAYFNAGAAARPTVLRKMGLNVPPSTHFFVHKKNATRITRAAYKISVKARVQRQRLRAKRKSSADKNSYAAGSFGVSSKPEAYCKVVKKSLTSKSKKGGLRRGVSGGGGGGGGNLELKFVSDKDVLMIKSLAI